MHDTLTILSAGFLVSGALMLFFAIRLRRKARQLGGETDRKEERLNQAPAEELVAADLSKNKALTEKLAAAKPVAARLKETLNANLLAVAKIKAGLLPPVFCHTDSEELKKKIRDVRLRQYEIIKSDNATAAFTSWTWFGSASKGEEMLAAYKSLLLQAFNAEFDAIRKQMRYGTKDTAENKLRKLDEVLSNLGETAGCYVTNQYFAAKSEELRIWWKELERKELEKKEIQRQKAILREQAKAKLPDTETMEETISYKYSDLKKAREIARSLAGIDAQQAQAKIDRLEAEIQALEEKFTRATSQAQITRAGYVYVISNVGSFGDGIVKIGMTRRLEPMDRVRELGDASVPYRFDVHALVFVDDAPSLERTLHEQFTERRVNKDNLRKEFFQTTPEEVCGALSNLGINGDWFFNAEAREYYESELMRAARSKATSKESRTSESFPEAI
jgi:hypothetical protein